MKASRDKEVRFESSVQLFQFCKTMLAQKRGTLKVIDQEVGQLLSFDPAYCSHWKNGKKQIKSIFAMRTLAQQLDIDESIVSAVAFGELNHDQAALECTTYGKLEFDQAFLEQARKEYFKQNQNLNSDELQRSFERQFDIQAEPIRELVTSIHKAIGFQESPLFLPQIFQHYSPLQFTVSSSHSGVSSSWDEQKLKFTIQCNEENVNSALSRFLIAQELSVFFFHQAGLDLKIHGKTLEIMRSRFAAELLAPQRILRSELKKIDPRKNIVLALAESLWVSPRVIQLQLQAMA